MKLSTKVALTIAIPLTASCVVAAVVCYKKTKRSDTREEIKCFPTSAESAANDPVIIALRKEEERLNNES